MNEEELKLVLAEKKAYMKEWRRKNKERVKIHNTRYWLKRSQENKLKGDEHHDNITRTG